MLIGRSTAWRMPDARLPPSFPPNMTLISTQHDRHFHPTRPSFPPNTTAISTLHDRHFHSGRRPAARRAANQKEKIGGGGGERGRPIAPPRARRGPAGRRDSAISPDGRVGLMINQSIEWPRSNFVHIPRWIAALLRPKQT